MKNSRCQNKLKILILHNKYQQDGGEDVVVANEVELLRNNGHDVELLMLDNAEIQGIASKVSAFLNVNYSKKSRQWLFNHLLLHKPNLVHVHNFFPLMTPSVYDACIELNVPVVQTLHNYRVVCPGALLMRNGSTCSKCLGGAFYHSALYRCYKGSFLGSVSVANMLHYHKKKNTWNTKVDKYIALTHFAKKKFIEAGINSSKISIKGNFVADDPNDLTTHSNSREGALFVGRIKKEKGILTLLNAWKNIDYPLRVVGTGDLEHELLGKDTNTIKYLGNLSSKDVKKEMSKALFLILPSEWYEGFPMVLVEAFSVGLPAIASCLGAMEEIIDDGVNGLHFSPGNIYDLRSKVELLTKDKKLAVTMGENARSDYLKKYSDRINYLTLLSIYESAMDSKNVSGVKGLADSNGIHHTA